MMNLAEEKIIDCDVHVAPRSADEIKAYLDQPWKHRFSIRKNTYYKNPCPPTDKQPPTGEPAGSDPNFLREQLIDRFGVYRAILMTQGHVTANHDPDYSNAVARAYNTWLSDTWLGAYNQDGVFKGSIAVNHADPAAAAAEIDHWAGHPHFVQVQMDTGARAPFGQRQYLPILEAAERNQLPIAIHPGGESMGINMPVWVGHPSHYTEYYTGFSFAMQSHLVSLLTEGAFERFPKLKVVIAEGGAAWLPALLWRLDQEWMALRSEVPWLTRRPSEYVREHVRFTTQPMERPEKDEDLLEVLAMMEAEHLMMYSSDYPESDLQSPDAALSWMPPEWASSIVHGNARDWYGL